MVRYSRGFHSRFGKKPIKPRSLTKVLQSLQGQLPVVHVLILDLKTNNDKAFVISSGTSFHILDPKIPSVSSKMRCMYISIC